MWGPGWMAEKGCHVYLFLFYCSFSKEKNWNPYKLCWTLCVGSGDPHYPGHRVLAFLPLPGWSCYYPSSLAISHVCTWVEWKGCCLMKELSYVFFFSTLLLRAICARTLCLQSISQGYLFFISLKRWQARISQDRHADTDDHSTHSFIPGKMLPKLLTRSSLTFISNVNLILEISYEIPSQSLPNQWMDLRKILNLCIFNISSTS